MRDFRFLEPAWLALLLVVILLGAGQARMAGRRRRTAIRYTNAELVRLVLPPRPGWRRQLVAGLFLAGLTAGILAAARPAAAFEVERAHATVMLAMDVSPSMMATDVDPTRFDAAVDAAHRFLDSLPRGFDVGVTSVAGTAQVLLPPTANRSQAHQVIERLHFRSETAIGDAVVASVEAARAATEPGSALVILMSDGASTTGTSVDDALAIARDADVPVSTVAFGTDGGTVTLGGNEVAVPPDGDTLRDIAERSGGEFVRATTSDELAVAYQQLGGRLRSRTEVRELYAIAALAAIALLVTSAAGSLMWLGRLV